MAGTDHKRTRHACSELVFGRSLMPVCLQHHISLPVKTQKACKMSLDSEMVMKISPLNYIDLTQNNLVACGHCFALATFTHKHDTQDLMCQR